MLCLRKTYLQWHSMGRSIVPDSRVRGTRKLIHHYHIFRKTGTACTHYKTSTPLGGVPGWCTHCAWGYHQQTLICHKFHAKQFFLSFFLGWRRPSLITGLSRWCAPNHVGPKKLMPCFCLFVCKAVTPLTPPFC